MSATYTKLKSGDWGVKILGERPGVGSRCKVVKKSGEERYETIEKVVWSGDGVHIAAIQVGGGGGHRTKSKSIELNDKYWCDYCFDEYDTGYCYCGKGRHT